MQDMNPFFTLSPFRLCKLRLPNASAILHRRRAAGAPGLAAREQPRRGRTAKERELAAAARTEAALGGAQEGDCYGRTKIATDGRKSGGRLRRHQVPAALAGASRRVYP